MTDQALFVREGDWFVPTAFTTGPWRPDAMHGGPPSSLIGLAIQSALEAGQRVARINIDLEKRRVTPFPADILEQIAVMKAAHSALPKPDVLGQPVGIPPRAKSGKVELH